MLKFFDYNLAYQKNKEELETALPSIIIPETIKENDIILSNYFSVDGLDSITKRIDKILEKEESFSLPPIDEDLNEAARYVNRT